MYYLSHFLAGDTFALLAEEKTTLLVSSMEKGRAEKESTADNVLSTSEYEIMEKLKKSGKPDQAYLEVLRGVPLRSQRISCRRAKPLPCRNLPASSPGF